MVGQGNGLGGADGCHQRCLPGLRHHGRSIGRCRPTQANQGHHKGHQHPAKHHLATLLPIAAHQAQHKKPATQQRRQDAKGAAVVDAKHHHPHQHPAEHGHAGAQQEKAPPAGLAQGCLGLPREHQGQHRHQQHSPIGQKAKQGEGLAKQASPGTGKDLFTAVTAKKGLLRTAQGTQQPPFLKGDRARIDRTDGGQHRNRHPNPAVAPGLTPATVGTQALTEAGRSHRGASVKRTKA